MLIIHYTMVLSGILRNSAIFLLYNVVHTPVISLSIITILSGHMIKCAIYVIYLCFYCYFIFLMNF